MGAEMARTAGSAAGNPPAQESPCAAVQNAIMARTQNSQPHRTKFR